jgi:hypothetical protein
LAQCSLWRLLLLCMRNECSSQRPMRIEGVRTCLQLTFFTAYLLTLCKRSRDAFSACCHHDCLTHVCTTAGSHSNTRQNERAAFFAQTTCMETIPLCAAACMYATNTQLGALVHDHLGACGSAPDLPTWSAASPVLTLQHYRLYQMPKAIPFLASLHHTAHRVTLAPGHCEHGPQQRQACPLITFNFTAHHCQRCQQAPD